MKYLMSLLGGLVLCLLAPAAFAQKSAPLREPDYSKPALFADFSAPVPVAESSFAALIDLPVGSTVSLPISTSFRLDGVVVSRSDDRDPCVRSVVIRSAARGGATFSLARVCRPGGAFDWSGRMLGYNGGDALELVQEGGRYHLVKRALYDLLSE